MWTITGLDHVCWMARERQTARAHWGNVMTQDYWLHLDLDLCDTDLCGLNFKVDVTTAVFSCRKNSCSILHSTRVGLQLLLSHGVSNLWCSPRVNFFVFYLIFCFYRYSIFLFTGIPVRWCLDSLHIKHWSRTRLNWTKYNTVDDSHQHTRLIDPCTLNQFAATENLQPLVFFSGNKKHQKWIDLFCT